MKLFKRENYLSKIRPFYHEQDIIKVITGIRRCGKSSIMEMIKDELLECGVKESNIIYINLEKRGYKSIKTTEQLESLIDGLTNKTNDLKYLFIDEIQNVKNFEEAINAYRTDGLYSIFITGSNSYLLSGEMVTKLTGRYLEFEIFTLNFSEYLEMKRFYKKQISYNLSDELTNFIHDGGFPRSIFFDNSNDKRYYVKGIVDEIFKKDISRHSIIKRKETFEIVRDYVINNAGTTTSVDNILKDLYKHGLSLSKSTLLKYLKHLVDAKILYVCDRFDMKSRRMLSGEKKYYLADISLSFVTNPNSRTNYGQVLENIFFLYAKSKQYDVYVGRIGQIECDFILKDQDLNYSYFQISYTIINSAETEAREYLPLEKIKDNYPKYVLTTDHLIQKRNGIIHDNLLAFMVNNKI